MSEKQIEIIETMQLIREQKWLIKTVLGEYMAMNLPYLERQIPKALNFVRLAEGVELAMEQENSEESIYPSSLSVPTERLPHSRLDEPMSMADRQALACMQQVEDVDDPQGTNQGSNLNQSYSNASGPADDALDYDTDEDNSLEVKDVNMIVNAGAKPN